jgi:hypothetical protein
MIRAPGFVAFPTAHRFLRAFKQWKIAGIKMVVEGGLDHALNPSHYLTATNFPLNA